MFIQRTIGSWVLMFAVYKHKMIYSCCLTFVWSNACSGKFGFKTSKRKEVASRIMLRCKRTPKDAQSGTNCRTESQRPNLNKDQFKQYESQKQIGFYKLLRLREIDVDELLKKSSSHSPANWIGRSNCAPDRLSWSITHDMIIPEERGLWWHCSQQGNRPPFVTSSEQSWRQPAHWHTCKLQGNNSKFAARLVNGQT